MKIMKGLGRIGITFCIVLLVLSNLFVGEKGAVAMNHAAKKVVMGDGIVSWIPTGSFNKSAFVRVDREVPSTFPTQNNELSLLAVQNGQVSAQLALTSEQDLKEVQVEVGDLQAVTGNAVISGEQVMVSYPKFILNEGAGGGLIADPLLTIDRIDIPASKVQPVWFDFVIPEDAESGIYTTQIKITANEKEAVTYQVTLEVANVTLPDPEDFNFHLNMWMQPDSVAVAHDVEPWSDKHWTLLKEYIRDISSRGQKVINTVLADDPWQIRQPDGSYRAQTYTPYGNLVDWTYDGESWSFDYALFDKYVEISLQEGMGPYIHAFGMVMFGNDHLKYTDTRTGKVMDEAVQLGDTLWKDAWSSFLPDFEQHLRDKGWLDYTLLAFDERPQATMQIAFDFLEEFAPVFKDKLAIAADSNGLEPYSAEISFNYSATGIASNDVIQKRRDDGKITTFYTYYAPHHPNTNTISPLIGSRTLPWISAQHDLDGYLRWTYNSWPADVFNKPSYQYTQGDEYIVYPGEDGPLSSLRWEQFRNGVEDFELIKQLRMQAGSENPILKKALGMVQADLPASDDVFENLLEARKLIINELEAFGDVKISLQPEQSFVKAGEQIELIATIENNEKFDLTDVEMALEVPSGWVIQAIDPTKIAILKSREQFSVAFKAQVPKDEKIGQLAPLNGKVLFKRHQEQVQLPLSNVLKILDPRLIPQSEMTAKATSEEVGVDSAAFAIDGVADTLWHTAWSGADALPQSITLALGDIYDVDEFTYLPRQSGVNGIITQYKLYTSEDGVHFTEVAEGTWENNKDEKRVQLAGVEASYLKLEAIQGVGGYASAAELNVFQKEPVETITTARIKQQITQFQSEGQFKNEQAVHSLQMHLTALEQYEKQENAEKVIKHLKSLTILLDFQKDQKQMTDQAHQSLVKSTDELMIRWEEIVGS